jgi:hypothetical protein
MPCRPLVSDDGKIYGWACSRGHDGAPPERCQACNRRRPTKLCDYSLKGKQEGKTCDRKLCERCAVQRQTGRPVFGKPPPVVDLCPAHARLWDKQRSNIDDNK